MSLNKLAILGCGLLLLTGCSEARFASGRTVMLTFPSPMEGNKVVLSTNDAQVQEALRLVDSVLIADGFVLDSKRPAGTEPDLVASYAKFNASRLREVGTPSVYLRNGQLEVVVSEIGNRSGRPSKASKQTCAALQEKLSSRFGANRVRAADAD